MVKYVNASNYQVSCDKCKRVTPAGSYYDLRANMLKLGWYRIDTNNKTAYVDICDICAKKQTLYDLAKL